MTPPIATIPTTTALLCSALVWVPLTVWILSMIQWMVSGELDGITGVLGTAACFVIGAMTMNPPIPILSPILCAMTYLTVLAFPTMKNLFNRAQLHSIEMDILANAYDGLRQRPDNVGLRLKVARLLYQRGLAGSAIVLAENTLKGLPPGPFDNELKLLNDWKRATGNVTVHRSLPCLDCGCTNAAGELVCKRCGAPVLLHHAQGKWLGADLGRRIVAAWAALVLALVGSPLIYSRLDGLMMGAAFTALAVAVVGLILKAVLPSRRRHT